jgi:hypothetical protein
MEDVVHLLALLSLLEVPLEDKQLAAEFQALTGPGHSLTINASIHKGCMVSHRNLTVVFSAKEVRVMEANQTVATIDDGALKAANTKIPRYNRPWTRQYVSKPEGLVQLVNCVLAPSAPFSSAAGGSKWTQESPLLLVCADNESQLEKNRDRAAIDLIEKMPARAGSELQWRMTTAEFIGKPARFRRLRYVESYGDGGGYTGGNSIEWSASPSSKAVTPHGRKHSGSAE